MSELWQVMQSIEANRHHAEMLEKRARGTDRSHELWADIARQRRELAEQRYALFEGRDLVPVSPLRWND